MFIVRPSHPKLEKGSNRPQQSAVAKLDRVWYKRAQRSVGHNSQRNRRLNHRSIATMDRFVRVPDERIERNFTAAQTCDRERWQKISLGDFHCDRPLYTTVRLCNR